MQCALSSKEPRETPTIHKKKMSKDPITLKNAQDSFQSFYEGWLQRQQTLLNQLHDASTVPDNSPNKIDHQKTLIESVLSHYQDYFQEKANLANDDVFLLFSPTWLSSYERALLWIGDYKPSLILRVADDAAGDLTAEQREALDRLWKETRRCESELSAAMAGVQESVAGPRVLGAASRVGRLLDGEIGELDALKKALLDVIEKGDELRVFTVRKVAGVLTPPQTARFLEAALGFQLRARSWCSERDQPHRGGGGLN